MGLRRVFTFLSIVMILLSKINALAMPIETTRRDSVTVFYVNMLALPDPVLTKLDDMIFNSELRKEFRGRYIDIFGTVDTEALTYRNTQYAEMNERTPDQATFENSRTQRRQYGEFVIKRLVEWHADNYMKSEPELRKVYDAKEAISNIAVPVSQNVRLDMNISLAGDIIEFTLHNPYLETRYVIDPKQQENKLIVSKSYDEKTKLQAEALEKDGIAAFEIQRMMTKKISAVLRESSWYNPTGKSERETKTSLNFGYMF